MTKREIIIRLQQNHQSFTHYMKTLDPGEFMFSLNKEKWTAGQQLQHIYLSVKPLASGLVLPKFIVGLVFGKANRPSKTYLELVGKYHEKLRNGGKASKNFIPKTVVFTEKERLNEQTLAVVDKVCKYLGKYSEDEMDKHILPHPLLGKITLREMMYFTICHVEHHHTMTIQNLAHRN
jgi:hypothetical protein